MVSVDNSWFFTSRIGGFLWLLTELELALDGPIKSFSDNRTSIGVAHDLVQHVRTKHIETAFDI